MTGLAESAHHLAVTDLFLSIGGLATALLAIAGAYFMIRRNIAREVQRHTAAQITGQITAAITAEVAPLRRELLGEGGHPSLRDELTEIAETVARIGEKTAANGAAVEGVSHRLAELRREFSDFLTAAAVHRRDR